MNGIKHIALKKLAGVIFSFSILLSIPSGWIVSQVSAGDRVWGSKPLLSYFVLTPSLFDMMQAQVDLPDPSWDTVISVARVEFYRLRQLEELSQLVVANRTAPLWFKRLQIIWMQYNRQVGAILTETDLQLQNELSFIEYEQLIGWIEKRWPIEVWIHGRPEVNILPSSRSFQIYATRYDSGGAYYVALPDKCVKFTNGGNSICSDEGYVVGQKYSVYLSYNGSTGAVVGESGPWNVDDNYWSDWDDPTPRRMFSDLPVGMPEAQAAYFNGYNGGTDQFGRKVTGPFGIDLARQVSIDIGLQPGTNDWITVTYLWTEGWDSLVPGSTGATGVPGATAVVSLDIAPVQVASPQSDGSIIHTVQYGQSLWQIAVAYSTTIQSITQLNDLSDNTVIWPGDELIIFPAGSFLPTQTATRQATLEQLPTTFPTLAVEARISASPVSQATELASKSATETSSTLVRSSTPSAVIWVLVFGVGFVILGLALVGLGRFFLNR